jgi:CRISP-associated protein Cas1
MFWVANRSGSTPRHFERVRLYFLHASRVIGPIVCGHLVPVIAMSIDAFLTRENFQAAWLRVAKNKGCAGVDGETIGHFARNADRYLDRLLKQVKTGQYQPLPLRQLWIPKKDGTWRGLGVPTVRDRIVQQALLNVLHPVMEPQFEDCSFAYRPGRSHLSAVRQVNYWHHQGYEWVLDGDLVKYFDNVQFPRLLDEVVERLGPSDERGSIESPNALDTEIYGLLIEQWLSAGVMTKEGLLIPNQGLAQGSVISPILANIYLDDFDEIMLAAGLKLVRYADDFVLLGQTETQVREAEQLVKKTLIEMGLELHPEKTRVTNFTTGFRFLGQVFSGDLIIREQGKTKAQVQREQQQLPQLEVPLDRLIYADPDLKPTLIEQAMVEAMRHLNQPIPPPLFVVLGYGVREVGPVPIESKEWSWSSGMATLYLVQQGMMLRKEQGRFVVQEGSVKGRPGLQTEIPIREVERILVLGNVQISTTAISVCLEEQIPIVFLTQLGDYKGHLWSSEFCDLPVEAAQYGRRRDEGFQVRMVQQILTGKLMNSKLLLLRLDRKRRVEGLRAKLGRLDQHLAAIAQTMDLDALRGYEGAAARLYFGVLGQMIVHPDFVLQGRSRRPPKDPVNSLLSFGYTLLFNNVLSLILAEGLNPYLGNLHRSDRKAPHLAFDLMEEFRSPIVDSLVMWLVNKKVLRPTDFTFPNAEGGVYLEEAGRRVFLKHFEDRISSPVRYRDLQEPVSYRRVIQLQVQQYKRCLMESELYEPFIRAV